MVKRYSSSTYVFAVAITDNDATVTFPLPNI